MAIEMRQEIAGKETRLPLLGSTLLTPETIEKLKLPESIAALGPTVIEQFLMGQYARYQLVANRQEIKSLECEVPEYLHDEKQMLHVASALSTQEQISFDEWASSLVSTQSVDLDQLDQDVDRFVEDMIRAHPELANRRNASDPSPTRTHPSDTSNPSNRPPQGQASTRNSSFDPSRPNSAIDTMLSDDLGRSVNQETQAERQRWIDAFNSNRGNPQMLALLYGYRTSGQAQNRLTALLELERATNDEMDRLQAEFDLEGPNPSQEALSRFNTAFSRLSTDRTTNIQMIQQAVSDMERDTTLVSKIVETVATMQQNIVRNIS